MANVTMLIAEIKELTSIGEQLEACDYNRKFIGYPGFTEGSIKKEEKILREIAQKIIAKLDAAGVDVYELDEETGIDKNILEDLDYALQFI